MSQNELVRKIRKLSGGGKASLSQTLVARLEEGKLQDPRPEVLQAICAVTELGLKYEQLISVLIAEKYGIEDQLLSPLSRQPLDLTRLAAWEAGQQELWIAASRILDPENVSLLDAVCEVVSKPGGKVVFFVPAALGSTIVTVRQLVRNRTSEAAASRLKEVLLEPDQQAVLATSFVIANASDRDAGRHGGYLILNDERGEPSFAIQMFAREVGDRIGLMNMLLDQYGAAIAADRGASRQRNAKRGAP